MQTTNFDSEFCGNLPIHHINTVQPHGAVMLVDKSEHKIIQASKNISAYISLDMADVVGQPLAKFTELDTVACEALFKEGIKKQVPLTMKLDGKTMSLMVSEQSQFFIIEIQAEGESGGNKIGGLQQIRELIAALESTDEVQQACELIVAELQRMLGIDGVMMYKFDADWNGTVIAEVKVNGLEPYLGVTFPASDVPRQARELYLKNPIRLIADRTYKPSRLYPVINPLTNSFTDLSTCFLRGVSDVHLEYMANMGVQASMSLRVIHNGKLWGLISCNHASAYHLSFEDCANLALLTNVISTKISSIINNKEYQFVSDLQHDRHTMIDAIYKLGMAKGLLQGKKNVLDLFKVSAAVLFKDGERHTVGEMPDESFLDDLYLWLQAKNIDQVYSTHNLSSVMEEAGAYAEIASGMLVIPVANREPDFLVCFRPEFEKTIEWGGNPHQTVNFEEGGKVYHPRNSFKVWMETVKQTARPWHEQEIQIANTVRSFLLEYQS